MCGEHCYSTVPCEVCFQGPSSCILYSTCIGIVSPCWLEITYREQWGHTHSTNDTTHANNRAYRRQYRFCRSSQTRPALQSSDPRWEPPSSVDTQCIYWSFRFRSLNASRMWNSTTFLYLSKTTDQINGKHVIYSPVCCKMQRKRKRDMSVKLAQIIWQRVH